LEQAALALAQQQTFQAQQAQLMQQLAQQWL
jgi:hypothetical protein